jgi:signal transduction histidine kinase
LLQKEDMLGSDERLQYLRIVLDRVTVLSHLVDSLFELSKLDAQDAQPMFEQFSLSEHIHDVAVQMQPRANEAGVRLEAKEPQSLYLVDGDVELIERVLTNLIDNAVNHSVRGGHVSLDLEDQETMVRVAVTDTGPGIEPADAQRVFDRFYIGDRSRSSARRGSGLGLAIAKRIVELHGGSIGVSSERGRGSCFYFNLPRGIAPGPAASR